MQVVFGFVSGRVATKHQTLTYLFSPRLGAVL